MLDCISVAYSLRDNDVFPSVNMESRRQVEMYQRSGVKCCLCLQSASESAGSSETLVAVYELRGATYQTFASVGVELFAYYFAVSI